MNGLQKVFSDIAPSYDLANHILTLGLDIPWRRKAARQGAGRGGRLWLDVCSGPGEMARNLARLAPQETMIVAADFTPAMLTAGTKKSGRAGVRPVVSEAGTLPFPDRTFDLLTISFATRNINTGRDHLLRRFREFRRVLKHGGLFLNLETSQPKSDVVRKIFHGYVKTVVKPVGTFLSGSSAGYIYLSTTIPRFFDAAALVGLMSAAGFRNVSHTPLMLGAVAIHQGWT